jgi:hypothetical protein
LKLIEDIRRLVVDEQFEITIHAMERMAERGVSTEGLISLITRGEIIESYPEDFPYPSVLLLGYLSGVAFHVVVAKGKNLIKVVTVYRADEEIWLNHRTRKM